MLEFLPNQMHKTVRKYSELGDAVEVDLVGSRNIIISDPELAKEVLSKRSKLLRRDTDMDYSAHKLSVSTGLLHSNGAVWSHIRRGTAPSFSNQSMKRQFLPILKQVQHWIKHLHIEAQTTAETTAKLTATTSTKKVLDMKFEAFSSTIRIITVVAFGLSIDDPVNDYFFSKQCRDDITQLNDCSQEEVWSYDTFFMSLPYIHGIVKEILRLYTPVEGITMETESGIDSVTIGVDVTIYKDEFYWVNTEGIHRDARYFDDPLTFQPERWMTQDAAKLQHIEDAFFTFGAGPRLCPGMNLALLEVCIDIAWLAVHFDFKLACPKEEMYRKVSFAIWSNKMLVVLIPRKLTGSHQE